MEEEERQGSRSSQDKDTVDEEIEPSIEAGVSKVNSIKKAQPKIDPIEPGKPKNVPGKTHSGHTEPREQIGETGNGALNEEEDKSDNMNQPSEEPRYENEMEREEGENSGKTKRKVSGT